LCCFKFNFFFSSFFIIGYYFHVSFFCRVLPFSLTFLCLPLRSDSLIFLWFPWTVKVAFVRPHVSSPKRIRGFWWVALRYTVRESGT
jgi:hypothetical protein